jgi:hypothetical protein
MKTLTWQTLVLSLATIAHASARELPTPTVFPIVVSGERTRVGITFHLNPDCTSAGKITVRLLEAPKNGTVEILTERTYADYEKTDPKFKCNEQLSEMPAFYYTSREGFKGRDRFSIEIFYPNANYRKRVFNVDVR